MRGPNKKKGDGHSVEHLDEERRASIISTSSTGSAVSDLNSYRFPEVPPAVQASVAVSRPESRMSLPHINSPQPPSPSPQRQLSRSRGVSIDIPSSPLRYSFGDVITGSMSPSSDQTQIMGPPFARAPRPRPPPLHLGDAGFLSSPSAFLRSPLTPDIPLRHSADIEDPTYAARRQSLPSYLASSFMPTPASAAAECFSQHSDQTHSRSTSTSEAPLTPLTAPDSMFDLQGELGYADDMGMGYEHGRTLDDIQEVKEIAVTVVNVSPMEAYMSDGEVQA